MDKRLLGADIENSDGLNVQFKTGSGNIEIGGLKITINASFGSGNIQMKDLNGEFKSNTGSGNLSFMDMEGLLRANTESGCIRIEYLNGDADLNTGSGNTQIVLVDVLNYDLSLNIGSGDVVLDFNGQEIAGKFIMKASDKDDIRAPFRFDEEYGDDDDDDNRRGWRGNRGRYTKEATVGNKNIVIKKLVQVRAEHR